jgi:hypothetical protein
MIVNSQCYALIVARDEQTRVGAVIRNTIGCIPVLVIDDASVDDTCSESLTAGAIVLIRPSSTGKGWHSITQNMGRFLHHLPGW